MGGLFRLCHVFLVTNSPKMANLPIVSARLVESGAVLPTSNMEVVSTA